MGVNIDVETSIFTEEAIVICMCSGHMYLAFKEIGTIISGYNWKGVSYDEVISVYNQNISSMNKLINLYAITLPECLEKIKNLYESADAVIVEGSAETSATEFGDSFTIESLNASGSDSLTYAEDVKGEDIKRKFSEILGYLNEIKAFFSLLEWESTNSGEFKSAINSAIEEHYAAVEEFGVEFCNMIGEKTTSIDAAEVTNKAYGDFATILEGFGNISQFLKDTSSTNWTPSSDNKQTNPEDTTNPNDTKNPSSGKYDTIPEKGNKSDREYLDDIIIDYRPEDGASLEEWEEYENFLREIDRQNNTETISAIVNEELSVISEEKGKIKETKKDTEKTTKDAKKERKEQVKSELEENRKNYPSGADGDSEYMDWLIETYKPAEDASADEWNEYRDTLNAARKHVEAQNKITYGESDAIIRINKELDDATRSRDAAKTATKKSRKSENNAAKEVTNSGSSSENVTTITSNYSSYNSNEDFINAIEDAYPDNASSEYASTYASALENFTESNDFNNLTDGQKSKIYNLLMQCQGGTPKNKLSDL